MDWNSMGIGWVAKILYVVLGLQRRVLMMGGFCEGMNGRMLEVLRRGDMVEVYHREEATFTGFLEEVLLIKC